MFNLLPGQGLGFTGSKEIAFGLAPVVVTDTRITIPIKSSGGSSSHGRGIPRTIPVFDNLYSKILEDDEEILEILCTIFGVIE